MQPLRRNLYVLLVLAACSLVVVGTAQAQITSGNLAGTVTAQEDGAALPGVTVNAVHQPTGTTYSVVTGSDGRYVIPNARVGGPYRVTATLEGFRVVEVSDVTVNIGSTTQVPIRLGLATVSEAIEVLGEADDLINPNRSGSTSRVSLEEIENLPTVNRSLQDFARTNPYFNVDADDPSGTRFSVAGRHERMNNIQIDGAVNNDLFGLADTGTPGGQANTQPISLDAIEQIQLAVSPYDVRQGGFTGGAINAVTRSGSNQLRGSIYGSVRDEAMVGDGPFDREVSDFSEDQYGLRIGGPIMEDQLFFFASGEVNRKEEPDGVSADGSTGTQYIDPAGAQRVRQFTINTFGYDPGGLGEILGATDSDLAFARLDWNVAQGHSLTLRHNYVEAARDVISGRATFFLRFPNSIYTFDSETNSTVAQLNSVLSPSVFNEARVGFQKIREKRNVGEPFPSVEIGGSPRRADLTLGAEQFSAANALDQDILEITDDLTLLRDAHQITLGTHNEIFEFGNLFLASGFGYYHFPSIEAYEAGVAGEYQFTFAETDDPFTRFEVRQYGLYGGDQWRVNDQFTLTYGLRADLPDFVDSPTFNPAVQADLGLDTSTTPSDDIVWSPRIGFNWSPGSDAKQQVRGGIGIFSGRAPYVWISNAYGNTGIGTVSLFARGDIPFEPDPFNQPRSFPASGGSIRVAALDPDFELPQVMRATLGYDRELFGGFRGSAEVLYTKTQEDVFVINAAKRQVGTSPLDGRPVYGSIDQGYRDAIVLTNTDEGEQTLASIQLERPLTDGLILRAAYTYMDAESAFDASSSQAHSNFQFRPTPGDIFEDDVATSYYEVEDRFQVAATYLFATGRLNHNLGLFFNAQSGRPYSLLFGTDINGDGYSTNDLLFVPGSTDAIILQDASGAVIPYSTFASFLASAGIDPTAGRILDRNESQEPWSHLLDLHYGLEIPVGRFRPELTFDVLNLLNLIDSDKGVVEFVTFNTFTPVTFRGIDAATGKPIYREASAGTLDPGAQFSTADLRSRWQAKIGVRLSF